MASPAGGAGSLDADAASSLVVAGRVILLLAAVAALAAALILARDPDGTGSRAGGPYACPMHAEVVSATPGDCPICGMALTPVRAQGPAPIEDGRAEAARQVVLATPVWAPAWRAADGVVTAILHADDLVGMTPGERAVFFDDAAPAVGVDVRRLADEPAAVDASTSKVAFGIVEGAAARASSGVGLLRLAGRPRAVLVVPASAVLYSADGPYVLAASRDGDGFAKRRVEIGRILDSSYAAGVSGDSLGATVVLSGLRAGERVVARDTFFLDAERRLRLARGEGEWGTP